MNNLAHTPPRHRHWASNHLFVLGLIFSSLPTWAGMPMFTQQQMSGGSITDGLDISSIRIGTHPGFERLVFDIVHWEGNVEQAGQAATLPGHFHIEPVAAGREYAIQLGGFRAFSTATPVFHSSSRIASLERRKGERYEDDSSIALLIRLKAELCYRAFALDTPARFVIDIGECP
jgi:hypothetical protein